MKMDNILKQINEDIDRVRSIVQHKERYPSDTIPDILDRVEHNAELYMSRQGLKEGDWCQVHVADTSEPFYAKIKSISKDGFVSLIGIYNYTGENNQERQYNSYPLDQVLPIRPSLGSALEYANGNNRRF